MIWNNFYNKVLVMQISLFFFHGMKLWTGTPGAIANLKLGDGYGAVRGLLSSSRLSSKDLPCKESKLILTARR